MPWHLVTRGTTLVSLHWVDVRGARRWVPPEVRIIPFLPGRTIGGLFVTEYGPGSELRYNELIAVAATVWHERRLCAWVTHLYVDSEDSVEGGRKLLGAPKRYAPFTRTDDGSGGVTVGDPEQPICRIRTGRRFWLWRQRLRLVALHYDARDASGCRAVVHGNELRGRIGVTRTRVEIPESSPLHPIGLDQAFFGGCLQETEAVLGGAAFFPMRLLDVEPPVAR